jgi:hypothetical protein
MVQERMFFSKAALVTFGGAYAGGCSRGLVVFSQLADDALELPGFVLLDH